MMRRASSAVGAQCTWPPSADDLALELLEVEVEVGQRVVLDVARAVAQRLELGQPLGRLPPPLGEADLQLAERILQVGIGAAHRGTLCLKSCAVDCISGLSPIARVVAHVGQHLGDVAHLHRAALALQLARHVHQAAEIAGQQRVGAGRGDVAGLLADHGVGDLGILHAERAAEAAAHFWRLHLAQREALHRAEQACAAAASHRARAGPSRNRDRSTAPS